MPKKLGAKRVNIYATERCLSDMDFLCRRMEQDDVSRSRLIRILVDAEVARVMAAKGKAKRSAVR